MKIHEAKIPPSATKEDKYCLFIIANPLADRQLQLVHPTSVKNINHRQLATNTGYAVIHYSNPGVSIASSLVQQNQLGASNNFITSFA